MNLLKSKKIWVALAILGLLGGIAYWQRGRFLAGSFVSQLAQADKANRAALVERVVGLGECVLPDLLALLQGGNKQATENGEAALTALARHWSEDPRGLTLVNQLLQRWDTFGNQGKIAALQVPLPLLKKEMNVGPDVPRTVAALVKIASPVDDLRPATLRLAAALVEVAPEGPWLEPCRALALEGLTGRGTETRLAAVQFVLRGPLRLDGDVLEKVVPLLKDSSTAIRMAALAALGPAREIIGDDDLLPLLHDPDDEVQQVCELALRSRGLQESHILLARLISDERPAVRLQVLQHLRQADDLDPGVWLRRLCQDAAPAVRAAAARAAADQTEVDLRGCLDEMSRQDPSPTVRELAGHYLRRAAGKKNVDY